MTVILATRNKSKYRSISTLLGFLAEKIGKDIQVNPLPDHISPPAEKSESSLENCKSKVAYYSKFISGPFVTVDDSIEVKGESLAFSDHQFHSLGGSTNKTNLELLDYLYSLIKNDVVRKATISRYFGFPEEGKAKIVVNKFNCVLKPIKENEYMSLRKSEILDNPLNYFMVTNKGVRVIDLGKDRINIVYTQNTKTSLTNFISKL